ncbi:MAG: FAD-linked oxidase [Ignavibacteriaceae bacterium]|nr:MAG: FAD-binding oxidoreductase [Chlorobiota bacterium]GJQ31531.1 MAG: FAD-linked oxidase [Ignavibacteriaceae bacterium]
MSTEDQIIHKIKGEIGEDHLHDASNYRGECDDLYYPPDTESFARLLSALYAEGKKITIAGARTGLTGGCVPEGGALISTDRMNRIGPFDRERETVTCGPGVLLADLQEHLRQHGYFFPADPTETLCTIGGVVANNSSGARSYKYGSARGFVTAAEVVFAVGARLRLQRGDVIEQGGYFSFEADGKPFRLPAPMLKMPSTKNAAGYYFKPGCDLLDLLVGSEGTLCVFTEVTLKVLPLPERLLSCVAFFESVEGALGFVSKSRRHGVTETRSHGDTETRSLEAVRALEFFDGNSLGFLRDDFPKVPEGKAAAVWFEVEATNENFDEVVIEWAGRLEVVGVPLEEVWMPVDPAGVEEIRKFRHAVSWKVSEYIKQKGLRKLGTDTAVPIEAFDDYYRWAIAMVREAGIKYVAYGHFGDCHLHLNMLPKDNTEYVTGKGIYLELCRKAVELGGTVSAEHGIGKLKKEYLKLMYGEEGIGEMRKVKRYLDPKNLLNTGNLFD